MFVGPVDERWDERWEGGKDEGGGEGDDGDFDVADGGSYDFSVGGGEEDDECREKLLQRRDFDIFYRRKSKSVTAINRREEED